MFDHRVKFDLVNSFRGKLEASLTRVCTYTRENAEVQLSSGDAEPSVLNGQLNGSFVAWTWVITLGIEVSRNSDTYGRRRNFICAGKNSENPGTMLLTFGPDDLRR